MLISRSSHYATGGLRLTLKFLNFKIWHAAMKKNVMRAIYWIFIAVVFSVPFTGLTADPPDSIEGKIAVFIKEYPPFDVKMARREAEEAFPMNKIGDEV